MFARGSAYEVRIRTPVAGVLGQAQEGRQAGRRPEGERSCCVDTGMGRRAVSYDKERGDRNGGKHGWERIRGRT